MTVPALPPRSLLLLLPYTQLTIFNLVVPNNDPLGGQFARTTYSLPAFRYPNSYYLQSYTAVYQQVEVGQGRAKCLASPNSITITDVSTYTQLRTPMQKTGIRPEMHLLSYYFLLLTNTYSPTTQQPNKQTSKQANKRKSKHDARGVLRHSHSK
ncbi:hypothetical protein GGR50DRAFT_536872 [Xylaria sp. CBS 124048]|nr:hypothetical protein GGR50DRAFT_536872 [Xylaria sp. CBS 124048]